MCNSQRVNYVALSTCHVKKLKESIDKANEFGALSTNLSKAFDRIGLKLLISELFSYGI